MQPGSSKRPARSSSRTVPSELTLGGGGSCVLDGLGLNLCACSFPLQINPRLSQRGALRRLPRQHVLQQVPAVEVVGEVGFAPSFAPSPFPPTQKRKRKRWDCELLRRCRSAASRPRSSKYGLVKLIRRLMTVVTFITRVYSLSGSRFPSLETSDAVNTNEPTHPK